MVAITRIGSSFSNAFHYNERKVRTGSACLIHAGNFLEEKECLHAVNICKRFSRLNELNQKTNLNTVHISLNFHPAEKLQDLRLAGISDRYAEMMGLANQPFLVYKHTDAGHPHVHVVSNLIDHAGKRIAIQWPVHLFSREACRKIESEFGLLSGPFKDAAKKPQTDTPQKIRYGETPLLQSMEQVLRKVLSEFHFGTLQDFNALLSQYNLYADRRSENSRTYRHGGLVYQALNKEGKRIGVPVKASAFDMRPNLQQIIGKIEGSKNCLQEMMDSVKSRIDWSLLQCGAGWDHLLENLQQEDIRLIGASGQTREQEAVFLDLRQKAVFRSTALGPAYSPSAMKTRMENNQEAYGITWSNTLNGVEQRPSASDHADPSSNSIECTGDLIRRIMKR